MLKTPNGFLLCTYSQFYLSGPCVITVLLCLCPHPLAHCCPATLGVPPSLMGAAPGPLHMLFLEVRFFVTASLTSHRISMPCPLPAEPSPVCSWGSRTCLLHVPLLCWPPSCVRKGPPAELHVWHCYHTRPALTAPTVVEQKKERTGCVLVLACRVLRAGPASRCLCVCLNELRPAQACCCDPPLVASPALRLRRGPDPSAGVSDHRGCSLFLRHARPRFSSDPGAGSALSRARCRHTSVARLCSWWSGAAVPGSQVWGHLRSGSEEAAPSLSPAWRGALSPMAPGPLARGREGHPTALARSAASLPTSGSDLMGFQSSGQVTGCARNVPFPPHGA